MIEKTASIVLGLQFGDEGKGRMVDYLCRKTDVENTIVVRFSGGQQAGHTVVTNDQRHVFSSFGSGTLVGVPTFISQFCTINPLNIVNEYNILKEKVKNIEKVKLIIHPLAMITTPFDIAFNRASEMPNNHGSCGMGIGTTMNRSLTTQWKLYATDMLNKEIFLLKIRNIERYYENRLKELPSIAKEAYYRFLSESQYGKYIQESLNIPKYVEISSNIKDYSNYIFEGSQGILLDMDHGIFPNVTYANTTSKNALVICKDLGINNGNINTYYITRTYKTRHGEGWMGSEYLGDTKPEELVDNTNVYNSWQKNLRFGPMDVDLLDYAYEIDRAYNNTKGNLVFTCLDQVNLEKDVISSNFVKKVGISHIFKSPSNLKPVNNET